MKIIIAGGTGQVGVMLARHFHGAGHDMLALGRHQQQAAWPVVPWDGVSVGDWGAALNGADVVINLAGRSVNCRYTPANRRQIMESRVNSTQAIGAAIARAAHPPRLWLQASTATIYAHRFDAPNDEATGILGGAEPNAPDAWRFSIEVAKAWERALDEAPTPHTRKVAMRSSMIMSADRGGIFDVLLRLVRFGLGGPVAGGRQYVSWIHEADFIGSVDWLIDHAELDGPVNVAAPNPLPYADFMNTLRAAWGMPIGLPATAWMVGIGAFLLQTETELVLKSRRVVPGRLMQSGYIFEWPQWVDAARDLCQRWREMQ